MVKKEIKTANELKKELEESKAKLALLNKKSRHSVKSKPKKKQPKKKTEVERPETKKLEVSKLEAKKKEAKKKAEEAKKKEEEAKKTYEEELEEQLTEEEITGFQIDKTDMDRLSNKVCEIVAEYETEGMFQSDLWKKLKLSSRDGSRLALKLERMGMISREKILENGRWTYKLIIKRTPVSTSSLEGAPC